MKNIASSAVIAGKGSEGPRLEIKRFYRPELDALRFLAFLAVLLYHGPSPTGVLHQIKNIGCFGLSMFFVLSAYLITELLLREREQSGTISWRLFFTRRALRIWPLYYAMLGSVFVIGRVLPNSNISSFGIAAMAVFLSNWIATDERVGPLAVLWSISVEEQFYLIWPPIVKFGAKRLVLITAICFIALAVVWLGVFSARGNKLWFDTPVEMLFFAVGALIALATHGKPPLGMNGLIRATLAIGGLLSLGVASNIGHVGVYGLHRITVPRLYVGYGAGAVGCGVLLLATMGISNVPYWMIYLGRISYGLYVFHGGFFSLSRLIKEPFGLSSSSGAYMLLIDGLALLFSIAAAYLSYKYLEAPFLRLKERFEIVPSGPSGAGVTGIAAR